MIGLITFHDTNNFGSYLQTYGLYKMVENLGYDCEVIDYQCEELVRREVPQPFRFKMNPKQWLIEILFERVKKRKYRSLSSDFRRLMKHSPRYNRGNVTEANGRYTTYLVGSDIVWGLDITKGDMAYFLDFANENVSKNAFAASIGNPWSEQEKRQVKPLLGRFDQICVRENESAVWVEELCPGKRVDVVCDPTMLLKADEWRKLSTDRYKGQKYVLVYFDHQGKCIQSAKEYAKKNGLDVYVVNYSKPVRGVKNVKPENIGDFLSLIDNASFVVTASYHGMLFSIYFNRQFAFYNRAHKSRMVTLAKNLEVADRDAQEKKVVDMPPIDYKQVNATVDAYRSRSIECLKQILSNEDNLR